MESSSTPFQLKKSKQEILGLWEERVREELRSSKGESRATIRDSIPLFLDALAESLEVGIEGVKTKLLKCSLEHGSDRANTTDFSIEEILHEYKLLREVIFSELESDHQLSRRDRDTILEVISFVIMKAVAQYANEQKIKQHESESQFRTMMETVPHIVWACNANSEMELVSRQFEEYTGLNIKESLGQNYSKLLLPEDFEVTKTVINEARRNRSSFSVFQRIRNKAGEYRWNLANGNPVFDENGEVIRWIGTTTDIHEQKVAEEHLWEVQNRFDIATITSRVGVWEYDIKTDGAWRSLSHDLVHGYDSKLEKWNMEIALAHIHPDDRERFKMTMSEAIEKKQNWIQEFRIIWPDGTTHWNLVRAEVTKNSDGEAEKIIGTTVDITEIKNAQNALKESEEKLRTLADSVPELVWSANASGDVDYYNDKIKLYAGVKVVKGVWKWEPMVHPDDEKKTIDTWSEAITTGTHYFCEHRIKMWDGSFRWHMSRATPLKDADGHVIKWFGAATDIHELKTAQEQARKSAEDIRRITDIQPTLISYVNQDHTFGFANQAYQNWFQPDSNEIIGKHAKEILGDKAYQKVLPYFEKALRGERQDFELWIPYRTGTKYIHAIYEPDLSPQNEVLGIFVSVADLTEQQTIMKKLKTSEQQFLSLANSIPQLAWMADPDGSIFWYNQRWFDYTGTTKQEMIGWGWQKVHHPDYVEPVMKKFKAKILNGDSWEDTFPIRSAGGDWRWFLSRAMPIKNSEGKIVRWFGTNTDITEQKELMDSLHEEQSLRDKFVSTLSHDLRTPLTAAKISAQLIKKRTEDEKVATFSFKIVESLNRADKMIQDLLDASKIRAGKGIVTDFEEIELIDLITRTLEDLATIHGDRFQVKAPSELHAFMSSDGIRRILENLCSNAIKYGSTIEPIKVTVVAGHENFCLCVENKGNPLINVDKKKLFEPFQQGQTGKKSGWGIGLTIVKGISDEHGGKVEVDSNESGTTFKVTLPLDARKYKELGHSVN